MIPQIQKHTWPVSFSFLDSNHVTIYYFHIIFLVNSEYCRLDDSPADGSYTQECESYGQGYQQFVHHPFSLQHASWQYQILNYRRGGGFFDLCEIPENIANLPLTWLDFIRLYCLAIFAIFATLFGYMILCLFCWK